MRLKENLFGSNLSNMPLEGSHNNFNFHQSILKMENIQEESKWDNVMTHNFSHVKQKQSMWSDLIRAVIIIFVIWSDETANGKQFYVF